MEIWKPVVGYEGLYEVSSFGRVRSFKKSTTPFNMRLCSHYRGYRTVYLYREKNKDIKCFVHRLVAEAFIPNLEGKPFVNHIDCDKTNNNVSNLEWMTEAENTQYYFAHRTPAVVDDIPF
jgi:hypothetical protein